MLYQKSVQKFIRNLSEIRSLFKKQDITNNCGNFYSWNVQENGKNTDEQFFAIWYNFEFLNCSLKSSSAKTQSIHSEYKH